MYKYREFLEMQEKELERYEEKLDRLFSRKAAAPPPAANTPDKDSQTDSPDGIAPSFSEIRLDSIKLPSFLDRK